MTQYDEPRHFFDASVYCAQGTYNLILNALSEVSTIAHTTVAFNFCPLRLSVRRITVNRYKGVCPPVICVIAYRDTAVIVLAVIKEIV